MKLKSGLAVGCLLQTCVTLTVAADEYHRGWCEGQYQAAEATKKRYAHFRELMPPKQVADNDRHTARLIHTIVQYVDWYVVMPVGPNAVAKDGVVAGCPSGIVIGHNILDLPEK